MRRYARISRVLIATAMLSAVAVPTTETGALGSPGRRPVLRASAAAVAVAGATGTLKPFATNGLSGVGFGFSQGSGLLWESVAQQAADLDGMVAAGASWVGADIDWPSIQAGGPNAWNWQPTDRLINAARSRGLQVLATADYTPVWARPANTSDKHAPNDPAQFATFVRAAATRYAANGVHAWQIWNEPNTAAFFQPHPDPQAYAQLLIAGADAIHSADPSAVVMNGGLAPAGNVAGQTIAPNDFLIQMYAAGIGGHVNAISMHPYSFPYSPTTPATWNPFYMLGYTHLIMTAFGDAGLPIWGTEAGFGTGQDAQSLSEAMQAVRMKELVVAWKQLPFAAKLFVYGYRDTLAGSTSVWDNMGMVHRDFSTKPAFAAFRSAVTSAPTPPVSGHHRRACVRNSPGRRLGSRGCS